MERVFTELSPRRDEIAQLYSMGNEKKEIADILCRSVTTVNATIQRVFTDLHVRNGRELAIKYAERMYGHSIVEVSQAYMAVRTGIMAMSLLLLFSFDLYMNESGCYRRSRRAEEERAEAHHEKDESIINMFA